MKTFKKKHLFWLTPLAVSFFLISAFFLFPEKLLEHAFSRAGMKEAQVGRIDFNLDGTVLTNLTLPSLGLTLEEVRLYATPAEIAHARLGKIVAQGIHWQAPQQQQSATSPALTTEAALSLLRPFFAALDTHSNEIDMKDVTFALAPGLPVLTGQGQVYDRGERYQLHFTFATPPSSSPEAAPAPPAFDLDAAVQADIYKGSGAAKVQIDLQHLSISLAPALTAKRITGWATLELPQESNAAPLLGAQIDAGALRLYDVPLTQASFSLSGDAAAVIGIFSARLPEQAKTKAGNGLQAELTLTRGQDAEVLSVKLGAKLEDLDTLGVTGVGGSALLDAQLQARKKAQSAYNDITSYDDIGGTINMTARNLSLAKAFTKADARVSGALTYDAASRSLAFASAAPLSVTALRDKEKWSLACAELNIDHAMAEQTTRFRMTRLETTTPYATLSDGQADIRITGYTAPVAEGMFTAALSSLDQPALFTSLKAAITFAPLSSQKDTTGFDVSLNGLTGALMIKATGRHNSATHKGEMNLQLVPLDMQQGVRSLAEFFPVTERYVAEVTGTLGVLAQASWGKDGKKGWQFRQIGRVLLRDLSGLYNGFPVEGINTVISFTQLAPPVFERQQVAIGAFTAGLPLQNGLVTLSLDQSNQLTVHDGHMEMAGGNIAVEPFTLDLAKQQADIVLTADQLDLRQLFAIAPMEGLSAEGRMQGRLPIALRAGNLTLTDGQLTSLGGGVLRYSPRELPTFLQGDTNQSLVDLRTALANFNFSSLKMGLRGDLLKEQAVTLTIEGSNPDFYSGHPVKLNLNVEGPLQNIVRYAPGSKNIPDAIHKQIEQFEDANATVAH